jgi:hypothetical protein
VLRLSDGLRARRFPIVNVAIIVANYAVWLFYELPHLRHAVFDASFYPCTVNPHLQRSRVLGCQLDHRNVPSRKLDHILGNSSSWPCSARTSRTPPRGTLAV